MSGSFEAVTGSISASGSWPNSRLSPWLLRTVVLALSIGFACIPFLVAGGYKLDKLRGPALFFSLALLPGVIGICFHIITANTRRVRGNRATRQGARKQERFVVTVDHTSSDPLGAISASLFLTGVFLLIAIFAGFEGDAKQGTAYNGAQGMIYAGFGAYVAVLYYMVARLYANALSSRFLLTSTLRSASAVVIGWVFGVVGLSALVTHTPGGQASTGALASNGVLFLIGLFHNSAIDMMRTRALKLFGSEDQDDDETSLTKVEGIDLTTADLLTEYGVGSIQHLATVDPGELCERTLLPLDRVLDWVDQALLIQYLRKQITVSRPLGIRGAINLAMVHMRAEGKPDGNDAKLLTSLAEKIGMPLAAIDNIARDMRNEYMVGLIYELQQGRPFPDPNTPATIPVPNIVTATTPALATDH